MKIYIYKSPFVTILNHLTWRTLPKAAKFKTLYSKSIVNNKKMSNVRVKKEKFMLAKLAVHHHARAGFNGKKTKIQASVPNTDTKYLIKKKQLLYTRISKVKNDYPGGEYSVFSSSCFFPLKRKKVFFFHF